MSVLPLVYSPGAKGPPWVSSSIALKLLKLNAKEATSSGATATSSSGSTTLAVVWKRLGPSMREASVSSLGMACRAPGETMIMEWKVIRMIDSDTEIYARVGVTTHVG